MEQDKEQVIAAIIEMTTDMSVTQLQKLFNYAVGLKA